MDLRGKNILITGINGFVGTAAAKSFIESGAHVIGLIKDYNHKTDNWVSHKCSIVDGDIRDKGAVQFAVSHYEVDYILHLASQAIVKICHSDPYVAYETNIMGAVNVLEAARIQSIPPEKILVMVSDKYYGSAPILPYVEDLPPAVADSYCTSKTCQDMISRSYAQTYGVPAVTIRAGNIYGPGDLNMSRIIPRNLVKLYKGESPVLYSAAKNMIREFLYVDDVIEAFKVLMDKGVPGEAYNIGGTEPMNIGDVMESIRNLVNPDIPLIVKDSGFSEISKQYLSAEKIGKLGWEPKVDFDTGLALSFEYYKNLVDAGEL